MSVQLTHIVKFVLENRDGTAICQGWSPSQIAQEIVECLQLNGLVVELDDADKSKIVGIVLAQPIPDYKRLHVVALLVKKEFRWKYRSIVKHFLAIYREKYPQWDIQCYRGEDNLIVYKNTERFTYLLGKISTT